METKDWLAALGLAVSAITLLIKFSENNRQARAHSVATRSFALAKAIDEITKDAPEGTTEEAGELREGLLSTGKEATRQYLDLARAERTIHVVDAAMYALVALFLGLSLTSIHKVTDIGPAWGVALQIAGVSLAALGSLMLAAVIRRLYQKWRDRPEAIPEGDQAGEVQLSHADES